MSGREIPEFVTVDLGDEQLQRSLQPSYDARHPTSMVRVIYRTLRAHTVKPDPVELVTIDLSDPELNISLQPAYHAGNELALVTAVCETLRAYAVKADG